ncbi:DUF397 domain-containing protein [Streptomyces sp. NPDC004763]
MIRTSSSTGLVWSKSSYSSGAETDSCVEVALDPDTVHVRDSKNLPDTGPRLALAPEAWVRFVAGTVRS